MLLLTPPRQGSYQHPQLAASLAVAPLDSCLVILPRPLDYSIDSPTRDRPSPSGPRKNASEEANTHEPPNAAVGNRKIGAGRGSAAA
jgi:hypothetical protein